MKVEDLKKAFDRSGDPSILLRHKKSGKRYSVSKDVVGAASMDWEDEDAYVYVGGSKEEQPDWKPKTFLGYRRGARTVWFWIRNMELVNGEQE